MIKRVRLLTSAAIALGIATGASAARAQSVTADGARDTETATIGSNDIVVTARRRSENLQEVPIAVTAIAGDALQDRGISDAVQLNQLVPSLRVEAFNSPTALNIGIRGVRPSEIAPGQDASVGVVVGDVSYGFTVGVSPLMFDLESIQALKGPQGTLFGRNTTGGVLILTPARPTDDLTGSVAAGATFFNGGEGMQGTGILNVPITEGVSVRAAIDYLARDGYVRNVTNPATASFYQTVPTTGPAHFRRLNDLDQLSWRLGGLIKPAVGVESYFLYQGARMRTNGAAYAPTAVRPGSPAAFIFSGTDGRPDILAEFSRFQQLQGENFWSAQANERTFARLDQWSLSNTTSVELTDGLTLKNIIGYRDFKREDQQDLDGFPFQLLDVSIPDKGHEFVEELQLQGESPNLDWVVGLFYTRQHIFRDNTRVVLNGADIGYAENLAEADSYAAYAQATWRIPGVQGISLTGGVRYTYDRRSLTHVNRSGRVDAGGTCALRVEGQLLPEDACVLEGETMYGTPTWHLSAAYQADPDTLLYASYSRGYRAGGFNYTATSDVNFGPFDPEYVDAFEIGLKRDWRLDGDASLRINFALFHSEYRDIQRFVVPVGGILPSIVNASNATIDGGEAEILLQPTGATQFGINYAYTRPNYVNFVTGQGDFSDNEFAQVSRHQLSLFGRFELPIPERLGDLSLRGDYYYQSRIFYTDTAQGPAFGPLDSQSQKGYGLLNLGLDWKRFMGSPVDLNIFINNATKTKYQPFGVVLYSSIGYNSATIGDPRVIGVQATLDF